MSVEPFPVQTDDDKPKSRFPFQAAAATIRLDTERLDYLAEDLFPARGLCVVRGPRKSYKSRRGYFARLSERRDQLGFNCRIIRQLSVRRTRGLAMMFVDETNQRVRENESALSFSEGGGELPGVHPNLTGAPALVRVRPDSTGLTSRCGFVSSSRAASVTGDR
jgi:hypothetical protein